MTALFTAYFFSEPFTPATGTGIVLITAGALLVEIGSHAAEKKVSK